MNNLLTLLNKYKYISLYFHERPDADALGACLGMYFFIKKHFPNIKVIIPEIENIEPSKFNIYFKDMYVKPSEFNISDSLALIFDTPISKRVFSKTFNEAKIKYKIDHHPYIETFTDFEYINTNISSTCEIVASWMKSTNLNVDSQILNPLLLGILFDTNRFSNPNIYSSTFNVVEWMINNGVDFYEISNLYILKSVIEFQKDIFISKKIKFDNNFAYLVLKSKKIKSSKINLLSNFSNINVWFSCYYDYVKKIWFGSIRSRNIIINHIANKYNGGGHIYAAGVKLNSKKEIKSLIKELSKLANE